MPAFSPRLVPIPVVLFAYARPDHLARVLRVIRENQVPLIYAFADGADCAARAGAVQQTRSLLRAIDWCEVRLVERPENCGLGRNVRTGVGEVLRQHEACIVWEDDLIAVPRTYAWLCAALRAYADDPRVMSVTAWTHPRVTPADVGEAPYFDARAECWVWGTWTRAWAGMEDGDACSKMAIAAKRGIAPDAYGADLPEQACLELQKNTWAVRWLYHHFSRGGLCVRPPWSMVEHIGFDAGATNAAGALEWQNPPLCAAPPVPEVWPAPIEHSACRAAWYAAVRPRTLRTRLWRRIRQLLKGTSA